MLYSFYFCVSPDRTPFAITSLGTASKLLMFMDFVLSLLSPGS